MVVERTRVREKAREWVKRGYVKMEERSQPTKQTWTCDTDHMSNTGPDYHGPVQASGLALDGLGLEASTAKPCKQAHDV